ncbi:hypothetical protein ACTXT7_015825 [Hymenolepis weldensis]
MAGYLRTDPTEVPTKVPATVMVFSVVKDSEGHIITQDLESMQMQMPMWRLQTTVVEPPCIDSTANRGRPYVFQQESAPSQKVLKTQDWMDG